MAERAHLLHSVKNRDVRVANLVGGAALLGSNASHSLGAVIDRGLSVKGTLRTMST